MGGGSGLTVPPEASTGQQLTTVPGRTEAVSGAEL